MASKKAKTVLVAEDSSSVRLVLQKILVNAGYNVLAAEDSDEAMKLCKENNFQIDMGVIDAVLPSTNGPDLARSLTKKCPDLKILFITGYSDSELAKRHLGFGSLHCLYKPFKPEQLLDKLKEIA